MRGNIVSPGRQLKGWLRVTSRSRGPCMGGAARVDLGHGPGVGLLRRAPCADAAGTAGPGKSAQRECGCEKGSPRSSHEPRSGALPQCSLDEHRFGLGFANERRQCPVGSKAHEHVDVISHYGLSDDVKGVAESGSPDALHHDLYVLSTDASLPPPGVPREMRKELKTPMARFAHGPESG